MTAPLRPSPKARSYVIDAQDAFARLTFLGWWGGLAAIVAGLALSFALFGYAIVYWRNADMDFMVIYNALVMNDGKPQAFFDHTAYLTILTVKSWFALLHGFGLLDAWTLPAIPPPTDAAGFDAAMTDAVRAGELAAKTKIYEPQLKLYAIALAKIYSRPVTHGWLHFLSARKTAEIKLTR